VPGVSYICSLNLSSVLRTLDHPLFAAPRTQPVHRWCRACNLNSSAYQQRLVLRCSFVELEQQFFEDIEYTWSLS